MAGAYVCLGDHRGVHDSSCSSCLSPANRSSQGPVARPGMSRGERRANSGAHAPQTPGQRHPPVRPGYPRPTRPMEGGMVPASGRRGVGTMTGSAAHAAPDRTGLSAGLFHATPAGPDRREEPGSSAGQATYWPPVEANGPGRSLRYALQLLSCTHHIGAAGAFLDCRAAHHYHRFPSARWCRKREERKVRAESLHGRSHHLRHSREHRGPRGRA